MNWGNESKSLFCQQLLKATMLPCLRQGLDKDWIFTIDIHLAKYKLFSHTETRRIRRKKTSSFPRLSVSDS